MMRVKIVSRSGLLPAYETSGSAGMDIRSEESLVIQPGDRALVSTGLYIELPEGYEAQIRARSGFAVRNGIGLVNGIGTIDSDYRGEIKVCLINWGKEPFEIQKGDRIAQMVVSRYERMVWDAVEDLEDSGRGSGGFGSSGR